MSKELMAELQAQVEVHPDVEVVVIDSEDELWTLKDVIFDDYNNRIVIEVE